MEEKLRERFTVAALLAAWIGIWGAWIPSQVGALRQNAFDMAEWATFLPEVRSGTLNVIPDILRLSIALITIAVAWRSLKIERVWLRWGIRFACIVPSLLLMPPYPFVMQLWGSESYGLRFTVASFTLIGVGLSPVAGRVPKQIWSAANAGLSLLAAGSALYTYLALQGSFSIRYGVKIEAGWGFIVFIIGLLLSVLMEGSTIIFPMRQI